MDVYFGVLDSRGNIVGGELVPLSPTEQPGQGKYLYSGEIECRFCGRHGLMIRVMPRHAILGTSLRTGADTLGVGPLPRGEGTACESGKTMINDITRDLVQQLAKTSSGTTFEAERQSTTRLQLNPGQQVQAEVLAGLADNRVLTRIAGELFKIELPLTVKPGETLQLTFVTDKPRITFSLSQSENSATPVRVSDTGKWLSMLARNGITRQQPTPLPRIESLLTGPPVDTANLATLLRNALTMNGVCYEAHLMQWFLGERQLKDILKEPQGKLASRIKPHPEAQPTLNKAVATEDFPAMEKPEDFFPGKLTNSGDKQETAEKVDARTIPIIQEQLHALQSGQLAWKGQAWPGQQLEWDVCEREPDSEANAGKNWLTSLRLSLPNLGKINATLKLNNEGVHLSITADNSSTVVEMQDERQILEQAMSAAGVNLLGMVVEQEEHGSET